VEGNYSHSLSVLGNRGLGNHEDDFYLGQHWSYMLRSVTYLSDGILRLPVSDAGALDIVTVIASPSGLLYRDLEDSSS